MTLDDILEIETLKYCYEQGYPLHRHDELPDLFVKSEDTVFTLPSENDLTVGFEKIEEKFKKDLYFVSPNEDSYHTGWQITLPVIWEKEAGIMTGIFPTFGHFVMNLVPELPFFQPPYNVNMTGEMWVDRFKKTQDGWRIARLQAEFMLGQPVWKWDARKDDTCATRKELRKIPHPFLGGKLKNIGTGTGTEKPSLSGPGITDLPADAFYGIQFAQGIHELEARKKALSDGKSFRVNMPAAQYLEKGPDEDHMTGHFTVLSVDMNGTAPGSRLTLVTGSLSNIYVKEDHIWKLKDSRFSLQHIYGPWETGEDRHLSEFLRNPAEWIGEVPEPYPLDGLTVSEKTKAILALRNCLSGAFHYYNTEKDWRRSGLKAEPDAGKKADALLKSVRTLFATSPVIRMTDDQKKAEAFFSVTAITDNDENNGTARSVRGSLAFSLYKKEDVFEVTGLDWYNYVRLDPWPVIR